MSRGFSDGFKSAKKDGKDSLSFSDKAKLIASNLKSGVSILLDGKTVNGSVVQRQVAEGTGTVNADGSGGIIISVSGLAFQPAAVFLSCVRTDQLGSNPTFSTDVTGAQTPTVFFRFSGFKGSDGVTTVLEGGQYTGVNGEYLNITASGFNAKIMQAYGTGSNSDNFNYKWRAFK